MDILNEKNPKKFATKVDEQVEVVLGRIKFLIEDAWDNESELNLTFHQKSFLFALENALIEVYGFNEIEECRRC